MSPFLNDFRNSYQMTFISPDDSNAWKISLKFHCCSSTTYVDPKWLAKQSTILCGVDATLPFHCISIGYAVDFVFHFASHQNSNGFNAIFCWTLLMYVCRIVFFVIFILWMLLYVIDSMMLSIQHPICRAHVLMCKIFKQYFVRLVKHDLSINWENSFFWRWVTMELVSVWL